MTASQTTILIVDDDRAHRLMIRRVLSAVTPQASCVETSTIAESASLLAAAPNLLCAIIDLNLFDGRGTEVVRYLRDTQPKVPIIVLSTSDLEHDRAESLAAGASCYLTKADDIGEFSNNLSSSILSLLGAQG